MEYSEGMWGAMYTPNVHCQATPGSKPLNSGTLHNSLAHTPCVLSVLAAAVVALCRWCHSFICTLDLQLVTSRLCVNRTFFRKGRR